jgi:hypothetical protein
MGDDFKEAVLTKLKEWVDSNPEPDKPIIGIGGGEALSPKQILENVNNETPVGKALTKSWTKLAVEHVLNAKVIKA